MSKALCNQQKQLFEANTRVQATIKNITLIQTRYSQIAQLSKTNPTEFSKLKQQAVQLKKCYDLQLDEKNKLDTSVKKIQEKINLFQQMREQLLKNSAVENEKDVFTSDFASLENDENSSSAKNAKKVDKQHKRSRSDTPFTELVKNRLSQSEKLQTCGSQRNLKTDEQIADIFKIAWTNFKNIFRVKFFCMLKNIYGRSWPPTSSRS